MTIWPWIADIVLSLPAIPPIRTSRRRSDVQTTRRSMKYVHKYFFKNEKCAAVFISSVGWLDERLWIAEGQEGAAGGVVTDDVSTAVVTTTPPLLRASCPSYTLTLPLLHLDIHNIHYSIKFTRTGFFIDTCGCAESSDCTSPMWIATVMKS